MAWAAPYIIDLSLDQAARPTKGLPLTAASFMVPPDRTATFLAGAWTGWRHEDGWTITYRVRPAVTWWQSSPNWRRRDAAKRARVVGAVIRALREDK